MGGNPPASKRDKFLLKVEILSSKRDLHELLDHQAEDRGNIVHTVMAAAYKRCKHSFNEGKECSKTLLRQSFTLTTRSRIVLVGANSQLQVHEHTPHKSYALSIVTAHL